MTVKAKGALRIFRTNPRDEVTDPPAIGARTLKPMACQKLLEQRDRPRLKRGHRWTADKRGGQLNWVNH
jgi:hypothetical protein